MHERHTSQMNRLPLMTWRAVPLVWAMVACAGAVQAQDKQVYRCPGNLYTDALSPKEAADKGCKTLDGAPVTVIQSQPRPPVVRAPSTAPSSGVSDRPPSEDTKARDADARRILEAELRKEEDTLAALKKDYNNGEPERRGDERNAQKYLDRVKEMKDAIARKEADIASIKRELGKLTAGSVGTSGGR